MPAQNLIHEPDERIVKKLYELIEQAELLIEKLESAHEKYAYVQEMHERLLNLQAKYEHTSPAIALLGPLGATGLVIQEQAIEKELADINRSFNTILN